MKIALRTLLAICVLALAGTANAQTTTQRLNNVIDFAKDIKSFAKDNRSALKTLTVDYFQMNNPTPNVAAYLAAMQLAQSNIESLQDDIFSEINFAAQQNSDIDPTNIQAWASQIEAREDFVQNESQALATNIAANQRQAARANVIAIRGYLGEQIQLANQIIAEAKAYKKRQTTYNVRIELVDNNGNPVGPNGLQGYWAFDQFKGVYLYPTNQTGDQFSNLPGGTYTFGAFDGYFDGASSEVVTLDNSQPTDANGFIVVQLVYWSE
jgi:glutamyl/glutaminyl-tRNA synthetase